AARPELISSLRLSPCVVYDHDGHARTKVTRIHLLDRRRATSCFRQLPRRVSGGRELLAGALDAPAQPGPAQEAGGRDGHDGRRGDDRQGHRELDEGDPHLGARDAGKAHAIAAAGADARTLLAAARNAPPTRPAIHVLSGAPPVVESGNRALAR